MSINIVNYKKTISQQILKLVVVSKLISIRFFLIILRYARQIEETEQHLITTGAGGSGSMTPDDLVKAMQKIHSAFISLAGKYEPIHDAVNQQKAIYLQRHR